jgi:hypothetical protein
MAAVLPKPAVYFSAFLFLLLTTGLGAADGRGQAKTAPPGESAPPRVADVPPRIEPIEPPRHKDRRVRYWLSARISAFDTMGFASVGGKKLQWMRLQGFEADQESSRQFRLNAGRHALLMYDHRYCYSLALIYRAPKPGERALSKVSTEDGSLKGWVVRHTPTAPTNLYLPTGPWKRFLALDAKGRARQPDAFRLEGSFRVRDDRSGLVGQIEDIALHSTKPLPLFTHYIDLQEQDAKEVYESRIQDTGVDAAKEKKWYEATRAGWEQTRHDKATELAVIEGVIHTGTGRPLLGGLIGS